MFYCAHLLYVVEFKGQNSYPLWENVHLIEADSAEHADELARQIGLEHQDLEYGSSFCDDQPARTVYVGIRKLLQVLEPTLRSGIELTYLELEVQTKDDVNKLLAQEAVTLVYDEPNWKK